MPYQQNNWTQKEITYALSNPVDAKSGPHAHSRIHAVSGELYEHPLFQKGRVQSIIHTDKQRESHKPFWEKDPAGKKKYKFSGKIRKKYPIPKPEVGKHSTLKRASVASALCQAFNHPHMQTYLGQLDKGSDMKVNVNFKSSIGVGKLHAPNQPSVDAQIVCLCIVSPTPATKIFRYSRPSFRMTVIQPRNRTFQSRAMRV